MCHRGAAWALFREGIRHGRALKRRQRKFTRTRHLQRRRNDYLFWLLSGQLPGSGHWWVICHYEGAVLVSVPPEDDGAGRRGRPCVGGSIVTPRPARTVVNAVHVMHTRCVKSPMERRSWLAAGRAR